jgi:hypothetical protein
MYIGCLLLDRFNRHTSSPSIPQSFPTTHTESKANPSTGDNSSKSLAVWLSRCKFAKGDPCDKIGGVSSNSFQQRHKCFHHPERHMRNVRCNTWDRYVFARPPLAESGISVSLNICRQNASCVCVQTLKRNRLPVPF